MNTVPHNNIPGQMRPAGPRFYPAPEPGQWNTRAIGDCVMEPSGWSGFCLSFCCMSCAYGKLTEMMDRGDAPCAGDCCCCSCCLHWTLSGPCQHILCLLCCCIPASGWFSWPVHICTRRAIRKKYGIDGSCSEVGRLISIAFHCLVCSVV